MAKRPSPSSLLYISVSSPEYWAELANVRDYGWSISPNTDNAPWFVVDTFYKKAYYTFVPPGGPGITVVKTTSQLMSQLPSKPPVILPTSSVPPTPPTILNMTLTPEGGDTFVEYSFSPTTFIDTGKTVPRANPSGTLAYIYTMYISGTVYRFAYSSSYIRGPGGGSYPLYDGVSIYTSSLNDPFTLGDSGKKIPFHTLTTLPFILGNKLWVWGGYLPYLSASTSDVVTHSYSSASYTAYTASTSDPTTWGYAGKINYYNNPRGQPVAAPITTGGRIIQSGSFIYQIMGYNGLASRPVTSSFYYTTTTNPLRWDLTTQSLAVPSQTGLGYKSNPAFATFAEKGYYNTYPSYGAYATISADHGNPVWFPWRNPMGQMFEVNGTLCILPGCQPTFEFVGKHLPMPVPTWPYLYTSCSYPPGGMFSSSAIISGWNNIFQWSASTDTPYYNQPANSQTRYPINVTRSTAFGRRETYSGRNVVAIGNKFYQVGGYTYHHDYSPSGGPYPYIQGLEPFVSASAGTFTGSVFNPCLPFTPYGQFPIPLSAGDVIIAPYSGTYYTIVYGGSTGIWDVYLLYGAPTPVYNIYAEAITASLVPSSQVINFGSTPPWKALPNRVSTPNTTSIAVLAAGTGSLSYQWYSGSTPLTESSTFNGTQTPTLKIHNPETATGLYKVSVVSSYGLATSSSLVSVSTSSSAISVGGFAFGDAEG